MLQGTFCYAVVAQWQRITFLHLWVSCPVGQVGVAGSTPVDGNMFLLLRFRLGYFFGFSSVRNRPIYVAAVSIIDIVWLHESLLVEFRPTSQPSVHWTTSLSDRLAD